jgi:hypothetical protein
MNLEKVTGNEECKGNKTFQKTEKRRRNRAAIGGGVESELFDRRQRRINYLLDNY